MSDDKKACMIQSTLECQRLVEESRNLLATLLARVNDCISDIQIIFLRTCFVGGYLTLKKENITEGHEEGRLHDVFLAVEAW